MVKSSFVLRIKFSGGRQFSSPKSPTSCSCKPLPPMLKDRRHSKTMSENGLNILTLSTKQTDFQDDRVLLLGQMTEKKEKADPSHFLKFLFPTRIAHIWFCPTHKPALPKTKRVQFLPTHIDVECVKITYTASMPPLTYFLSHQQGSMAE